jgi:hypothetical protein
MMSQIIYDSIGVMNLIKQNSKLPKKFFLTFRQNILKYNKKVAIMSYNT